MLGYDQPLFMLAMDHRGTRHMSMFGAAPVPTPPERARIRDAKQLIADGFRRGLDSGIPAITAGLLVDEEFGAEIARTARADGLTLAMPVEVAGLDHFAFEYGEEFAAHLEDFDPTFAKVLVRFNPEGDRAVNQTSLDRLARLSVWLAPRATKFLLELIVPATPQQLAAGDGESGFDADMRPRLTCDAMRTMQSVGIAADVWKIEGMERHEDFAMVAEQARSHGRTAVGCVVLSRGADVPTVHRWLAQAAGVDGFVGFALGRALWRDEVAGYLAGDLARRSAVTRISDNYRACVDTFTA